MKVLIFFIVLVLITIFLTNLDKIEKFNKVDPCTDYLSDIEFLEHMIPHHQVAIDMSVLLQPITKSPLMKEMCRKIIWQQKYEISVMTVMLEGLPDSVSNSKKKIKKNY